MVLATKYKEYSIQKMEKMCNGIINKIATPMNLKFGSGFGPENSFIAKLKKTIITKMYSIGKKKNLLNFVSFIFTFSGTLFCKPVATDQCQE